MGRETADSYDVTYLVKLLRKKYCKYPKILLTWIFHRVMHPKDADGMANSVDTDETEQSDLRLSALFAQTCLSENLGPLIR